MIQQLEMTLRAGAVPHAPQFSPSTVANSAQTATAAKLSNAGNAQSAKTGTSQAEKKPVSPSGETKGKPSSGNNALGDARSKVQEEISTEFAALMASGTLRASEAAALATKRVMQRYGHLNTAAQS